jgi:hypothetical protein
MAELELIPVEEEYDYSSSGNDAVKAKRRDVRRRKQNQFTLDMVEYVKTNEKLEADHGKAVGLICGLVDDFVRASLDHIIMDPMLTSKQSYHDIRHFMRLRYGPVNGNDAEAIARKVRNFKVTKTSDYKQFFQLVSDSQSLLRTIVKVDGNGIPVPDGTGGVTKYSLDNVTLRSILVKLLHGAPKGSDLSVTHLKTVTNANMTYDMIKNEVECQIKYLEVTLRQQLQVVGRAAKAALLQ